MLPALLFSSGCNTPQSRAFSRGLAASALRSALGGPEVQLKKVKGIEIIGEGLEIVKIRKREKKWLFVRVLMKRR